MARTYEDFEVDIGPTDLAGYTLRARSPMGQCAVPWQFPYDRSALEVRLKDLQIALLQSGGLRRKVLLPQEVTVQEFGTALYDSIFAGEVRSLFESSLRAAEERGRGLRLRLRFQAPDIAALPWEYLYYSPRGDFIALAADIPIVRQLPVAGVAEPLAIRPPLRILGMVANPANLPPIDARAERLTIERAVAPLVKRGMVELRWVEGRNWRDLQRELRSEKWHVLHFMGHGAFDKVAAEGVVYFCDDNGQAEPLTATNLNRILTTSTSLRLAVLNACQGAATDEQDIFSSCAATLVRGGIPAVVAMQYAITDRAATEFARTFYEALIDGLPVDTAMGEARRAVSVAVANTLEWGVPVLLMRSQDGKIFDVDTAAFRAAEPAAPTPEPTPEPTPALAPVPVPVAEVAPPVVSGTVRAAPPAGPAPHFVAGPARKESPVEESKPQRSPSWRWAGLLLALLLLGVVGWLGVRAYNSGLFGRVAVLPTSTAATAPLPPAVPDKGSVSAAQSDQPQTQQNPVLTAQFDPAVIASAEPELLLTLPAALQPELLITVLAAPEPEPTATPTPEPPAEPTPTLRSALRSIAGQPLTLLTPTSGDTRVSVATPAADSDFDPVAQIVFNEASWFLMGCDLESENCLEDEGPIHRVYLSPFNIDKYEVTNGRYAKCVDDGVCTPPHITASDTREEYFGNPEYDDYPVIHVDWFQAAAFCEWEGKRLPTDAEWARAAGSGQGSFPWGDEPPNCSLLNYAGEEDDSKCVGDTTRVGFYPEGASPYGAMDMAGNVGEWVADWYKADFFSLLPMANPDGPASGDERVIRSGSWDFGIDHIRLHNRDSNSPDNYFNDLGFRCAHTH